jgi:hypothetical protein
MEAWQLGPVTVKSFAAVTHSTLLARSPLVRVPEFEGVEQRLGHPQPNPHRRQFGVLFSELPGEAAQRVADSCPARHRRGHVIEQLGESGELRRKIVEDHIFLAGEVAEKCPLRSFRSGNNLIDGGDQRFGRREQPSGNKEARLGSVARQTKTVPSSISASSRSRTTRTIPSAIPALTPRPSTVSGQRSVVTR